MESPTFPDDFPADLKALIIETFERHEACSEMIDSIRIAFGDDARRAANDAVIVTRAIARAFQMGRADALLAIRAANQEDGSDDEMQRSLVRTVLLASASFAASTVVTPALPKIGPGSVAAFGEQVTRICKRAFMDDMNGPGMMFEGPPIGPST